MMRMPIQEAIAGKRENRLAEFETLAFPLMDKIYGTALRMTRNPFDAEDVVQETYLKAWRHFQKFESGSNFSRWIFRILVNNFINEYRKKRRQGAMPDFDKVCEVIADEAPGHSDVDGDGEYNTDYHELFDDAVVSALEGIPEQFRLVILLYDVNDLKYKEIAEILSWPIGTVMSRISRGRKMLARSLREYAVTNGFTK